MDDELRDLDLIKRQSKKIEDEIVKLTSEKRGKVINIFKMKENIMGPKKGGQDPTAIRDPETGELVVSNEKIKEVTLSYCVDNLTKQSTNKEVNMKK